MYGKMPAHNDGAGQETGYFRRALFESAVWTEHDGGDVDRDRLLFLAGGHLVRAGLLLALLVFASVLRVLRIVRIGTLFHTDADVVVIRLHRHANGRKASQECKEGKDLSKHLSG